MYCTKIKSVIRLTFFIILLFAGTASSKSLPPGTGQADVKANILIMLDTSGSMSAAVPFTPITISGPNDTDVDSNGNVHTINWNGGFISVHNYLGTPVTTYGQGGSSGYRASKIAIDSDDNVYGKNTSTLVKWKKTGINTWTEDWAVEINNSNGCGNGDDDSDIEIYDRTNQIYITDRETDKTCIYSTAGTFIGSRSTSPTHNYPYAIDSNNGVAYHFTSDSTLKVDYIDTTRTPEGTGTGESAYLGNIVTPPDFVYWSKVNDIEVDKRGDVYIADRTGGKSISFLHLILPVEVCNILEHIRVLGYHPDFLEYMDLVLIMLMMFFGERIIKVGRLLKRPLVLEIHGHVTVLSEAPHLNQECKLQQT